MRKKLSFSRGTLGLALAASVFFGCQDFMGEDKGAKASARAGDDALHSAKDGAPKDTLPGPHAMPSDTAKPVPGKGPDSLGCLPPKPADTAKNGDIVALCLKLQAQINAPDAMHDKESLNRLITQYTAARCPEVLKPEPPPPTDPVDSLTECAHAKMILDTQEPGTEKYIRTKEFYAAHCAIAPPSLPMGSLEECKYLWSEMQTATGQYQIDVKGKYVAKSCDQVLGGAQPPVPPKDTARPADPAALCKSLQADMLLFNETGDKASLEKTINLYNANKCPDILKPEPQPPPADTVTECEHAQWIMANLAPDSPKYIGAKEYFAAHCTDPAKPDPAPAANPGFQDSLAACKDLYSRMLSAAEPQYGELKDKFAAMRCPELIHVPDPLEPPPPPPDHATQCRNFRAAFAQMSPDEPKYLLYREMLAKDCADVP